MQGLMHGKRGLIMGVANDHSIAWGIARALAAQGAKLAFTYQGDALGKRVKPLAATVNADLVLPCDVEDVGSLDQVFAEIGRTWGTLDFLVHAIAFSDKTQLAGRYADTTRENFLHTMLISCFAFTEAAKRAAALMPNGGAMLTLTYNGGLRAMPNYNAMGVAKAALEASVRYLAVDFGAAGDPGQRDFLRADPHARRRRRRRRAHDVRVPAAALAAAPRGDARRARRRGALSALRSLDRGHRRNPFRRLRLQRHRHAAAGCAAGGSRAAGGRCGEVMRYSFSRCGITSLLNKASERSASASVILPRKR